MAMSAACQVPSRSPCSDLTAPPVAAPAGGKAVANRVDQVVEVVVSHVGQQQTELVTAESCHEVRGAMAVEQRRCCAPEVCVAGCMAFGVVEVLQPVQVDDDDGDVATVAGGSSVFTIERVHPGPPVGQPCEHVGHGTVFSVGEPTLEVADGGEQIGLRADEFDHRRGVAQWLGGEQYE